MPRRRPPAAATSASRVPSPPSATGVRRVSTPARQPQPGGDGARRGRRRQRPLEGRRGDHRDHGCLEPVDLEEPQQLVPPHALVGGPLAQGGEQARVVAHRHAEGAVPGRGRPPRPPRPPPLPVVGWSLRQRPNPARSSAPSGGVGALARGRPRRSGGWPSGSRCPPCPARSTTTRMPNGRALHGQRLGQRRQAVLGGVVHAQQRVGDPGADRRHEHHHAAAGLAHRRKRLPASPPRRRRGWSRTSRAPRRGRRPRRRRARRSPRCSRRSPGRRRRARGRRRRPRRRTRAR